jgi:hypothetical protein
MINKDDLFLVQRNNFDYYYACEKPISISFLIILVILLTFASVIIAWVLYKLWTKKKEKILKLKILNTLITNGKKIKKAHLNVVDKMEEKLKALKKLKTDQNLGSSSQVFFFFYF